MESSVGVPGIRSRSESPKHPYIKDYSYGALVQFRGPAARDNIKPVLKEVLSAPMSTMGCELVEVVGPAAALG